MQRRMSQESNMYKGEWVRIRSCTKENESGIEHVQRRMSQESNMYKGEWVSLSNGDEIIPGINHGVAFSPLALTLSRQKPNCLNKKYQTISPPAERNARYKEWRSLLIHH